MGLKEDVRRIKALADENRLAVMLALQHGEKCGCVLLEELNITQPTLSHHMKILCESGLVNGRKEGKWMQYSICCESVKQIRHMLRNLLGPDLVPETCRCEESKEGLAE